jgi:hypothetical protein
VVSGRNTARKQEGGVVFIRYNEEKYTGSIEYRRCFERPLVESPDFPEPIVRS